MNDAGAILRDRSDKALNTADFLESHHDGNKRSDEGLKDELLRLARFEQEVMTRCLKKLKECCGVDKRKRRTAELMDRYALQDFAVCGTDLFAAGYWSGEASYLVEVM